MDAHFERMVLAGKVDLPFSYSAGSTASRFFVELRDHRRIMGKKCPRCRRVIVPPQLLCNACFVETDQWVEVGTEGTLVTFTVVYRGGSHHPKDPPLTYGIIKLDGADTSLVHFLEETNVDQIKPGMRVKAVFAKERIGHILDIECFRPV